jgi:SAM-dependent methyltransferase
MDSPQQPGFIQGKQRVRPEDIDWGEMWREKQKHLDQNKNNDSREEHWDTIASLYQLWAEHDEYPTRLLQRIQMQRDWTVLDIGCGTGAIAISAAIRAKRVTALDISTKMLEILKTEAARRYLVNIQYIHREWELIRVGTDIKPHDVVIASRSIAKTRDVRESLRKIDQAARKFAYVTAWGGENGDFIRDFKTALNRVDQNPPDDLYVYNILRQMGIHPNVEQIECRNTVRYSDLDQALLSYRVLFRLTPDEENTALGFLKNHLILRNDGTCETPETRIIWSLFWWQKSDSEMIHRKTGI